MPLFRISADRLEAVPSTNFQKENLKERRDLQRLLRGDISPIGDDLMVVSEEFGDWEESSRRIDLLCLNRDGDLVVVEIKRTEDGGHMELQAIRYAAMVSGMTLDQVFRAYCAHRRCERDDAEKEIREFIGLSENDPGTLSGKVRIILVAADFSSELTNAVLWLNKHDLDITCIRLRPHKLGAETLVDVTQIIPLPESAEYEVKVRELEKERRRVDGRRQEILRRFWSQLVERSKVACTLHTNRKTSSDHWLSAGIGKSGFSLNLVLTGDTRQAECYIKLPPGREASLSAFRALEAQKEAIEKVFGEPLDWQELPGRLGCRICVTRPGGWTTPESDWPALQSGMIEDLVRLEKSLRAPIQKLTV